MSTQLALRLPDELLAAGYRPVGKDFPVFIHPTTGEVYVISSVGKMMAVLSPEGILKQALKLDNRVHDTTSVARMNGLQPDAQPEHRA